jgi:Protein of unknown function (DUF1236)
MDVEAMESCKGQVGKRNRKMDRLSETVQGSKFDRPQELVVPRVLHDQLIKLRPIMGSNCFLASLLTLSFVTVAVAQTPAPDSDALAHANFTTAQKQTIYQSTAKTQKNNAAPVGFRAAVGALVPSSVELASVPATVAELMPQTKGLEAGLVEGEVILVDPQDRKVITVVAAQPQP